MKLIYLEDTLWVFFELLANPSIIVQPSENSVAFVDVQKTKVVLLDLQQYNISSIVTLQFDAKCIV